MLFRDVCRCTGMGAHFTWYGLETVEKMFQVSRLQYCQVRYAVGASLGAILFAGLQS